MAEKETRVKVMIPRGASNEDPNLFVSVNGMNYLLPRGQESLVPKAVAMELNRAARAQEALDRRRDLLRSK
jgi:hypothetical protein